MSGIVIGTEAFTALLSSLFRLCNPGSCKCLSTSTSVRYLNIRSTTKADLRQISAELCALNGPVASADGHSSVLGLSGNDSGEGSSWQFVVGMGKCLASCNAVMSQCLFTNAGISANAERRRNFMRALVRAVSSSFRMFDVRETHLCTTIRAIAHQ